MRFRDALAYWHGIIGCDWPGAALAAALAEKFLAGVDVVDPLGLAQVYKRPCLYLANHQVFLESLMFNVVVPPLLGRPTVALGKREHHERWLGQLIDLLWDLPGGKPPAPIEYFDRENADEIVDVVGRLVERVESDGVSVLVHVEGTRRRSCRRGRVQAMSPLWTEVAVSHGWPIIPVRFVGGLPVEDLGLKFDAPVGYGKQIIRLGAPILPEELRDLSDAGRVARVRGAINELSDNLTEVPGTPDPAFAAEVEEQVERSGADRMAATILTALMHHRRAGAVLDPICASILAIADGYNVALPPEAAPLAAYLLGPQGRAAEPTLVFRLHAS